MSELRIPNNKEFFSCSTNKSQNEKTSSID